MDWDGFWSCSGPAFPYCPCFWSKMSIPSHSWSMQLTVYVTGVTVKRMPWVSQATLDFGIEYERWRILEVGLNVFCIIAMSLCGPWHGGLNENGPHRLLCLNTWSPHWWNYLGRIRQCGLGGGVSLRDGLWGVRSSHHFSSFSLWIALVDKDVSSQVLSQCHASLPPCSY